VETQPTPISCTQIVNQARNKAFWIFDPSTKTWYTPDEFHEKFQSAKSGFEDFFAQCQVRDPKDGVEAGMTKVQRMQDQLTGFINKVVTYYKQH
jgi:hypothetical protein